MKLYAKAIGNEEEGYLATIQEFEDFTVRASSFKLLPQEIMKAYHKKVSEAEKSGKPLPEYLLGRKEVRLVRETKVSKILSPIHYSLSYGEIGDKVFGKTGGLIYDKLNGADQKGNLVDFTDEEIVKLRKVLKDLANSINEVADKLK